MEIPKIHLPREEGEWQFVRSSGPGGQKVDKTSTKAVRRLHPKKSPYLAKVLTEEQRERVYENYKKYAPEVTKEGEMIIKSDRFRTREANIRDVMRKTDYVINRSLEKKKVRKKTKPSKAAKEKRLREKRRLSEKKQLRRKPAEF